MVIDPSTDIGKLRLRLGDFRDCPVLPDSVYAQTLADNSNNLVSSARILAQYILASLAYQTRSKISNMIESYDNQQFEQYRQFILDTISNPALMTYAPVAVITGDTTQPNPLIDFQKLWNAGYIQGTVNQEMQEFAAHPVESYDA